MAGVSKGAAGEVLAARFLRDNGYEVISANYRSRFGEIDIIAGDDQYSMFVEVKSRLENSLFLPREAVTAEKQKRIMKTAFLYLRQYPDTRQMRFDVIEVVMAKYHPMKAVEIRHIENAYGG